MKMSCRLMSAGAICVLVCAGCTSYFPRSRETGGADEKKSFIPSQPGVLADTCVPGPERLLPAFERLTYEMRWVGLRIGTLTVSIKGLEELDGRRVYVLEARAQTNKFASTFYRIDDRFVSYMDAENLCTLRHEVHRREGSFKKDSRTCFDQVNHKAYYINFEDNSEKSFDIPPRVQDTLTAFYYFRLLPMRVGDRVEYAVCNNEKNYLLLALIGGKELQRLPPPLDAAEMFPVEPFAELHGQRVEKGKVSAYYSWDERRVPLYAVIKAPVFTSVTFTLQRKELEQNGKR